MPLQRSPVDHFSAWKTVSLLDGAFADGGGVGLFVQSNACTLNRQRVSLWYVIVHGV